jgi:hypothetical protein
MAKTCSKEDFKKYTKGMDIFHEIDVSALFEGMDEGNWGIGMDWSTINLNL